MKRPLAKVFSALCALALLLAPAAAIAEGEQRDPIELNIGSDRNAWFVVPGDGLDTSKLYLDGAFYAPQVNQQGNLVARTGDLLAAKVIGENANEEPEIFQINTGKISLPYQISFTIPNYSEEAQPPTTETEADPNDNPFQYVEDRTSDERLSYPEDVIKQYAPFLIEGIANLIALLGKVAATEYSLTFGSSSWNPVQSTNLPALLTYATSKLSGDSVTAEDFDNVMYAIFSVLCSLDEVADDATVPVLAARTRNAVYISRLEGRFLYAMDMAGCFLPGYIKDNGKSRGPWRESDYGKLDKLARVQKKLKEANPFQLEGVTFELSDGAGNVQPIIVKNVWQSPIVKELNPNDMVLPEAVGSKPIPQ